MRGKIGLVVGLGVGYVLGTKAGRARYEQIRTQAEKVWELPFVQKQAEKVTGLAKRVPGAVFGGVVKVVKTAASTPGDAEDKASAAKGAAKDALDDVKKAAR